MNENKKKFKRRLISMVLVFLMLLTSVPLNVFAIAFEKQDLESPVSSSYYQKYMYQLETVDQTIKVGDQVFAEDSIANADRLPAGTRYYFIDEEIDLDLEKDYLDQDLDLDEIFADYVLDTSLPGAKEVEILVVYPDGSLEIVRATIKIEAQLADQDLEQLGLEEAKIDPMGRKIEDDFIIGPRSIISPVVDTHTYIFVNGTNEDGSDKVVDTQIVKNNEKLIEPEAPKKEGYKFIGWYYKIGEEEVKVEFGVEIDVPKTEQPKNTDFNVYPKFQEVYYVFFMDPTGEEARVFVTKEATSENNFTVNTKDVKLPIGSTKAVTGWYEQADLTGEKVADKYSIIKEDQKANRTLWPKIEEGNFISFITGEGGTYIEPQFVGPNGVTVKPEDPTRPGYSFSHWSTEENGKAFTFGSGLSEDLTLYAVWTAEEEVNYTVVIWKQSVKDAKDAADEAKTYDYAESEVRTAPAGTTVSPNYYDRYKDYTGFHYNAGKSVDVTVKGDGTTVLNVYYDRNLLTINFYNYYGYYEVLDPMTGLYGQTLAQNGYTWPSDYQWNEYVGNSNEGVLTFLDTFIFDNLSATQTTYPKDTLTLRNRGNSGGRYSINHYKQNLDGSYPTNPTNSTESNGGTFYFTNKYDGFTVKEYRVGDNGNFNLTQAGESVRYNKNLHIHYERNKYELAFYNYNRVYKTEDVLFKQPLTDKNYTPQRPDGLPAEYEFLGWYKDEAFTEKFNFETETMPAAGLTIYAQWAPPIVEGTIYTNLEGTESIKITPKYGQAIDPAQLPTVKDSQGAVLSAGNNTDFVKVPAGYTWLGWATKVGSDYVLWNFDTKVQGDIELYPYYVDGNSYTVTYDAGGANGDVPEDSKKYAEGSYADVMSPGGLTHPEGKVFLGWKAEPTLQESTDGADFAPLMVIRLGDINPVQLRAGELLQPGDKVQVQGNMTLTASWGDINTETTITYDPNGGTGSPISTELANNATHTIEANTFTREGYEFAGWNTNAEGTGTDYEVGTDVLVDRLNAESENTLYAKWKKKVTFTGESKTVTYNGSEQEITGITATGLLPGHRYEGLTYSAKGTTPDTYEGEFSGEVTILDENGNDVTNKYKVKKVPGKLTIEKASVVVTITGNSKTETYDGTEKTVTGYTVKTNNELYTEADFSFSGEALATGTNAGNYPMGLTAEQFANTNDNFTDVVFEVTDGELVIKKASVVVTITGNSKTETYDGTEKTITGYTVKTNNELYTEADFSFSGEALATGTNAGNYPMGLTAEQFANINKNFANVEFVVEDGKLVIEDNLVIPWDIIWPYDDSKPTGTHKAYVYGYPDGSFGINLNITRAEAAALIARLKGFDMTDASKPNFPDVVEDGWYNTAINAVVKNGLMVGYPDGTFRPDANITRAEFAQLIKNIDKKNSAVAPFADVKGHWAEPAINQAYGNGRIVGYPDGSFRPDAQITRAEAVTITNRLFNRNVDEKGLTVKLANPYMLKSFTDLDRFHWAYYEIMEASNTHDYERRFNNEIVENWLRIK